MKKKKSSTSSKKKIKAKMTQAPQGSILINRAKCTKCDSIIESKSVHDFVECKCGRIFVDGGLTYQRFGFKEISDLLIWNCATNDFEKVTNN